MERRDRTFPIRIDDSVLEDLHERLVRTRLPDQIEDTGWEYGMPVDYLGELVTYWRDSYDWRSEEAALNRFDHFRTAIDGQSIHFIHARSAHANALPLLITHGWPGSIVEFLEVIPRSDPSRALWRPCCRTPSTWWRRPFLAMASPSHRAPEAGTRCASPPRSPR